MIRIVSLGYYYVWHSMEVLRWVWHWVPRDRRLLYLWCPLRLLGEAPTQGSATSSTFCKFCHEKGVIGIKGRCRPSSLSYFSSFVQLISWTHKPSYCLSVSPFPQITMDKGLLDHKLFIDFGSTEEETGAVVNCETTDQQLIDSIFDIDWIASLHLPGILNHSPRAFYRHLPKRS